MNKSKQIKKLLFEPILRWKIVRGDKVEVITGKYSGQQGTVKKVLRKENKLIVDGINLVKKHVPSTKEYKGGVISIEKGIHYSNVLLVDPSDGRACRTGFRYLESGEKVRISKRTGALIPKPPYLRVRPRDRVGPLDTPATVVLRSTYQLSNRISAATPLDAAEASSTTSSSSTS